MKNMGKKSLILTVVMTMLFAMAGCGTTEKPVSENVSKITQAQSDAEGTSKEDTTKEKENVSDEDKEQTSAANQEQDVDVAVEYTTTSLKDIFDEGSINYDDCVDRVIDDIEFKIPSYDFFIRADYTVLYDEKYFSKYEQIFKANQFDVYMRRLNSTTYYIVFNTETEVGVEFAHTIKNRDEKTFDSILKTFNEALEEYLSNK